MGDLTLFYLYLLAVSTGIKLWMAKYQPMHEKGHSLNKYEKLTA